MSHAGAEWSNLLASLGRKLEVLKTAGKVDSHDTKHTEVRKCIINHGSGACSHPGLECRYMDYDTRDPEQEKSSQQYWLQCFSSTVLVLLGYGYC